ncbi:hypothetical protein ARMSODRAFT_1019961 [Armillaria solidipes]|uniref:Uncharacterized protein n=1 Tax=Armillaria solidipes TaxID=1076256 RepID=A0A2H3BLP4_9AGAR|nr:hypothetical protein ARMSODRAFT_1019961 [Armillaria solidipes]
MASSNPPTLEDVVAATASFVSHPDPTLDDAKKIIAMLAEYQQRNIDYMKLALSERQKAVSEEEQKREALEAKAFSMKHDILNLAGRSAEVLGFQDYVGKTDDPQEAQSIAVLTREFQPESKHNRRGHLRRKETKYHMLLSSVVELRAHSVEILCFE